MTTTGTYSNTTSGLNIKALQEAMGIIKEKKWVDKALNCSKHEKGFMVPLRYRETLIDTSPEGFLVERAPR